MSNYIVIRNHYIDNVINCYNSTQNKKRRIGIMKFLQELLNDYMKCTPIYRPISRPNFLPFTFLKTRHITIGNNLMLFFYLI